MGWRDQGRQEHGWFGDGTSAADKTSDASTRDDLFQPGALSQRMDAVIHGASHSKFGTAKMDEKFNHLTEDNVWNARLGYDLFASGRIGPSSTGAAILKSWPPP
jgi:hypothetical protein